MGKSKNATKALTQEEIWDDSALVQSWDEAVDEYKVSLLNESIGNLQNPDISHLTPSAYAKLYHSIQAKGENVEDVLRQAEGEEVPPENAPDQVDSDKIADEPMGTDVEGAANSVGLSEAVDPLPGGSSQVSDRQFLVDMNRTNLPKDDKRTAKCII